MTRHRLVVSFGLAAVAMLAASCGGDDPLVATSTCPASTAADPSADVWTTADGCRVDGERVRSHAGAAGCGWELVDELVLGDRIYHWDPVNLLAYIDGRTRNRTLRTADLPAGVVDSDLRRGDESLWQHPDDPEYVYLVHGDLADRYLLDAAGVIVCN